MSEWDWQEPGQQCNSNKYQLLKLHAGEDVGKGLFPTARILKNDDGDNGDDYDYHKEEEEEDITVAAAADDNDNGNDDSS